MRSFITLAIVLVTAVSVFGEIGHHPRRMLDADEIRPGRVLAMDSYSTSVSRINASQRTLREQAVEESRRLNRQNSAFSAYSSTFDNASSAINKVRILRDQRQQLKDYQEVAAQLKGRTHHEQIPEDDRADYDAVRQNSKSFQIIADANRKDLIDAERELRSIGKRIEKLEKGPKGQVAKGEKLQPADLARYNRGVDEIKTIQSLVAYNSIDDLLQSFDDYDDFFFKFNVGYEFTSVNNTFSSGNPRVDLFLYHRYRPYQLADKEFGGMFDFHTSFAARLAGSEEVKTDLTAQAGDGVGTGEKKFSVGKDKSLDYDINVYIPVCKTPTIKLDGRDRLYSFIGPLFVYGGKKVDDKKQIDQRLYGGLRFAISPETYTDVLYGKTESRSSRRLEVRGQMPIYRKENGSQVLLGAIANLGVSNRRNDPGDTVTVYAVWNLDVKDLFGIFR